MNSAEERGRRLGFLIASLDISAEQREALLDLLPGMTEEQLGELADVLEVGYLQAATKKTDKEFATELENIEKKFQQTARGINAGTNKELDAIA